VAGHNFSTGVPFIMNKDVAPVSVIASVVTMVIALRYCFIETPNIFQAMAAKLGRFAGMPEVVLLDSGVVEQLDVAIVMPLLLFSSTGSTERMFMIWAGSKGTAEKNGYIYVYGLLRPAPAKARKLCFVHPLCSRIPSCVDLLLCIWACELFLVIWFAPIPVVCNGCMTLFDVEPTRVTHIEICKPFMGFSTGLQRKAPEGQMRSVPVE
jgi:hypothetical protein